MVVAVRTCTGFYISSRSRRRQAQLRRAPLPRDAVVALFTAPGVAGGGTTRWPTLQPQTRHTAAFIRGLAAQAAAAPASPIAALLAATAVELGSDERSALAALLAKP